MRSIRTGLAAFALAAVLGVGTAQASTFSNPLGIKIPGGAPDITSGPASPYPSGIGVAAVPGRIADVNVTITSFTHTCGADVDTLLVGPGAQRTILLSDAHIHNCVAQPPPGATLTFDDEAASAYPCNQTPSGSFKPAQNAFTGSACPEGGDLFPPPAPGGPYPAALSVFDGINPNGAWALYVYDHAGGDVGSISGWSLDILPTVSCAGKPATVGTLVGAPAAGSETITGTPGPDIILGLAGRDRILGLGGNDLICGNESKDKLIGGPGKDLLMGGQGDDRLNGGNGRDTCKGGIGAGDKGKACEKEKAVEH
jgi:RTX calcium-binding nonapeptide repeat (4 copies)